MSHVTIRPTDLVRNITGHPLRLLAPVILTTLVALAYAVLRPATWEASQALVVRDEAGDRLTRPGKFTHTDVMKTSQETILELAKSRSVLSKALADVGPPANFPASTSWPNELALEGVQGQLKLTPPKGAEFGKTEMFYLKVQDSTPQRAVDLASAICRHLQARFAELRETKAGSTTQELTKSVDLAMQDLRTATKALSQMEQQVGGDLAELRILNESPSGDSDLRRTAIELEKELRTYQASQTESQAFRKLLTVAQGDPDRLLACPSVLLKAQPALGRLKDGLVDAELRTGQLLGTMSEEHPAVKGARAGEQAIREQLHDEIAVAVKGVDLDLLVTSDRVNTLEQQLSAIQARFGRLASLRAEYANLVTATKSRAETLKSVEQELAESRASQAAARTASLINLVDAPDAGTRPVGPGKTTIVAAGLGGGLMIALAIVFLTVVPSTTPASRRTIPFPASRGEAATGLTIKQALRRVSGYGV